MLETNIIRLLEESSREALLALRRSLSYAETSRDIINRCITLLPDDFIYDEVLDKWVRNNLNYWELERPPIDLYAKLLVLARYSEYLPEEIFLYILKAMNYFGNYESVINLSLKRIDNVAYGDLLSLCKHLCKAYKSLGMHDKALACYKDVITKDILHSADENNKILILVLLGKLYSDYHQKKGLYSTHIEIAYNRLNLDDSLDYRKAIPRLTADCYAKIILVDNQKLGESIYKRILASFEADSDRGQMERKCRIELNYETALLNLLIDKYDIDSSYDDTMSKLEKLNENIGILDIEFQNERAFAIRKVQIATLFRKLCEKLINYKLYDDLKNFFEKYSIAAIIKSLSKSIELCKWYSENKFLAMAYLEKVNWSELKIRKDGNTPTETDYEEWIRVLNAAIASLTTSKPGIYLVSDTYISVQSKLADYYLYTRDFSSALNAYQSLFRHFRIVLNDITMVVGNINDGDTAYSEFAIFHGNESELNKIRNSLFADYRLIADKLMQASDWIFKTQNDEMLKFIDDTFDMIKRTDYHEITNNLLNISAKIKNDLDGLTKRTREMSRDVSSIFKTEFFDPYKEAEQCLITRSRGNLNEHLKVVSDKNKPLQINFSKKCFNSILNVLINNVEKVAIQDMVSDWEISVCFVSKNEFIEDHLFNVVYLHVMDNVCKFDDFQDIIANINNCNYDAIRHDGYSGTGLSTIKKITSLSLPWQLHMLDQKNSVKELIIPLCVQQSM